VIGNESPVDAVKDHFTVSYLEIITFDKKIVDSGRRGNSRIGERITGQSKGIAGITVYRHRAWIFLVCRKSAMPCNLVSLETGGLFIESRCMTLRVKIFREV
jgi:hypothetical protein